MEVKLQQLWKLQSPKLVTELGMVMEDKLLQPPKQSSPKLVIELGIWLFLQPTISSFVKVLMMALQFSLESYTGLSSATIILSRPIHPKKHHLPKLVTEDGMLIEVRDIHKTYLETIDYQLFAFYTVEKWIGICLKECGW